MNYSPHQKCFHVVKGDLIVLFFLERLGLERMLPQSVHVNQDRFVRNGQILSVRYQAL